MGNLNLNNERVKSLLRLDKEKLVELFLATSLSKRKIEIHRDVDEAIWKYNNETMSDEQYEEDMQYYKEEIKSIAELEKQYFIN